VSGINDIAAEECGEGLGKLDPNLIVICINAGKERLVKRATVLRQRLDIGLSAIDLVSAYAVPVTVLSGVERVRAATLARQHRRPAAQ
jgi:hypothetical protein